MWLKLTSFVIFLSGSTRFPASIGVQSSFSTLESQLQTHFLNGGNYLSFFAHALQGRHYLLRNLFVFGIFKIPSSLPHSLLPTILNAKTIFGPLRPPWLAFTFARISWSCMVLRVLYCTNLQIAVPFVMPICSEIVLSILQSILQVLSILQSIPQFIRLQFILGYFFSVRCTAGFGLSPCYLQFEPDLTMVKSFTCADLLKFINLPEKAPNILMFVHRIGRLSQFTYIICHYHIVAV